MATAVLTEELRLNPVANTALKAAARLWFLVAVVGQWIFAYYVASFYGGSAVKGDFEAWNKVLPHGHIPGHTMGNVAVAAHLLFAVIVIVGGPLQLLPQVRERFPAFHRWNGRIYLLTAFTTSIVGLFMVWIRGGTVGGTVQHLGISLDAVLILFCGAMALRHALARDLRTHRRWALRLFMVVNGVWFFRVGLMLWLVLNNGPVGFDPKTFRGPFLDFWSFADYLLPLAVLEVYLRTQDRAGTLGKFAVAAGLLLLTGAMSVGVFAATMGMWLPRIK
jgi:uncharacterized membrane protein